METVLRGGVMIDLICHGDSLTEGAEVEPAYRWPALVANGLRITVANTGIGGDTTGGLLSRFPVDVVPKRPRFVLLLGGTNDLWWDLSVNTVLANICTMASQSAFHGIAPIVGTPPPVWVDAALRQSYAPPAGGYDRLTEKLVRLSDGLKTAAGQLDIPCVDFYRGLLSEKGEPRKALYAEDGLHLNREGHREMALSVCALMARDFFMDGLTEISAGWWEKP
jgi:lysophospholipase L1-like esterase